MTIALGRFRTVQGRLEEAREILDSVLRQHPHSLHALAELIACLRESDGAEELSQVRKSLPPLSLHNPWLLLLQRGALALHDGDKEAAAAAYHQLLQQDRTNIEAWQGLIRASRQTKDEQYLQSLKTLSALGRIQSLLTRSIQESTDASPFLDVADECAEVSLNWEGAVMTRCAQRLNPSHQRVINTATLFRERLAMEPLPSVARQLKDVASSSGKYFQRRWIGRGLAIGDIDRDGDLDAIVCHQVDTSVVLLNENPSNQTSVIVRPIGRNNSSRSAVGVRLTAKGIDPPLSIVIAGGGSFQSASASELHLGLGDRDAFDELELTWPDGKLDRWKDVAPGYYVAIEGRGFYKISTEDLLR